MAAAAEVDIFEEQEEALIEALERIPCDSGDEQAGTYQPVDHYRLRAGPPG